MGRGNCCVCGNYEGLYYVDNDFLDVYSRSDNSDDYDIRLKRDVDDYDSWDYNEAESYFNRDMLVHEFACEVMQRFPKFDYVNKWISRDRKAILENELFYVVLEDNEWSMAVELIEREDSWRDYSGLRAGLYMIYLNGIREILLDMFGEIGEYAGAWTHRIVTKGER